MTIAVVLALTSRIDQSAAQLEAQDDPCFCAGRLLGEFIGS